MHNRILPLPQACEHSLFHSLGGKNMNLQEIQSQQHLTDQWEKAQSIINQKGK